MGTKELAYCTSIQSGGPKFRLSAHSSRYSLFYHALKVQVLLPVDAKNYFCSLNASEHRNIWRTFSLMSRESTLS